MRRRKEMPPWGGRREGNVRGSHAGKNPRTRAERLEQTMLFDMDAEQRIGR